MTQVLIAQVKIGRNGSENVFWLFCRAAVTVQSTQQMQSKISAVSEFQNNRYEKYL